MEKLIYNSDNSAAILQGVKTSAIVTFNQVQRSTTARPKEFDSQKIALWGDNNDFPQKVIEDIRKDHELGPLLEKDALLLYSGGLTWGIPQINDKGDEILKPLPAADHRIVSNWMRRSNVNRYLYEASNDLRWFRNAFPEFVLQLDRSQIIQLCAQPAEECRWAKMNDKGIIELCYINANWPNATADDPLTKKVPVLDPYFDPASTLKAITKGFNFIYPLSFPSPGSTYYQLADWNGIRESGWLAYSQALPKFKASILKKITNIVYHIEISDQYWPLKYPDFDSKSDADKKKIVDTELKKFSDIMSGVEGTGNSIVTAMKTDFTLQKEFPMWKITAIDNKMPQGQFLEEMKEASLAKATAVGLHPALIGNVPNSGLGGAGSNIREAYNLNNIINKPKQDILLEPLYVVRDYNGWNPDMEFRIKNPFMTTLDKGTEMTNNKPT